MSDRVASWDANASAVLKQLSSWGYEVNLYGMADLETFLEAALLLPRSVTADFNFPTWNYFGRGSGKGRLHPERYRRHIVREGSVLHDVLGHQENSSTTINRWFFQLRPHRC